MLRRTMTLSKNNFQKAALFIQTHARDVDKALFNFYFDHGTSDDVLNALKAYQNSDGGFGHGLEADFRTPTSSNLATTIALQYVQSVKINGNNNLLNRALSFFAHSFSAAHNHWRPVPDDVNDHPHAPWWHLDGQTKQCVVEQSWENPTVEILGYLSHYPNTFPHDLINELIKITLTNLESLSEPPEHVLYCYQRFYRNTTDTIRKRIHERLGELIRAVVNTNADDWATQYVPKPLDFVNTPDSPFFSLFPDLIDKNLDFMIHELDKGVAWYPVWSWGQYEVEWEIARLEWAGKKTVDNLICLKNFSRIEY